jgi:hypothetical protein
MASRIISMVIEMIVYARMVEKSAASGAGRTRNMSTTRNDSCVSRWRYVGSSHSW